MGTKKDKNGRGLGDPGDIKKRRKEYMEELYKKKILMTRVITMMWSVTQS